MAGGRLVVSSHRPVPTCHWCPGGTDPKGVAGRRGRHDTDPLPRLLLLGDLSDTRALLQLLPDDDYAVTLAPDLQIAAELLHSVDPAPLVVTVLNGGTAGLLGGLRPAHPDVRWLAWNRHEVADLAVQAYEQGALAVLPGLVTEEGVRAALRTAFARLGGRGSRSRRTHGVVTYTRGTRIDVDEDEVLVVERGVVATQVLHEDGSEVLIGLSGPGDLLVGHPHDSCCLHLTAHSDAQVTAQSWAHAAMTPRFAERVRTRLWRIEAWAAVQARPHLTDRLIGLLSVVAERFGTVRGDATLIDVRLTHAHLAAALGTTRATVTRLIGRLRRARILDTIKIDREERFLLRLIERHRH
jgi:CRP-like cAMP-binding protein